MTKINPSIIARKGWLKVNLPVTILLIGSWLLLINFNGVNSRFNALIAGVIGWVYWEFAITKWIRWSLLQGIDKKELYKIGKRNFLVWSEISINKIASQLDKSNQNGTKN